MPDAQARRRKSVALPFAIEQVFALHFADAVGFARIRVVGCVAPEVFVDRLHEAAPINGLRTGEYVVRDAAAKQLDHRFDVARHERGVVEHHVERIAMRRERLFELAGNAPVGVDASRAVRNRRDVTVDQRHVVTAPREFEDEVETDVAIAAGDQHSHVVRSVRRIGRQRTAVRLTEAAVIANTGSNSGRSVAAPVIDR